jgi:phosphoribosylformylglycinamidine cyclo-ligase
VRKIIAEQGWGLDEHPPGLGRSLADELLEPTRIYVKSVLGLTRALRCKAIAHITGGGLVDNIPRVLPSGLQAVVRLGSFPVPPVFSLIRQAGAVADAEMIRTFNLGIGMVVIVDPGDAGQARQFLSQAGEKVYMIGELRERAVDHSAVQLENVGQVLQRNP